MKKLNNYDWYCDECNAYLNSQSGFSSSNGTWTCTECGETNFINEDNILSDSEIDDFQNSGYDSYNDYQQRGETIDKSDAALIWKSKGMDEDYTFGYSSAELEQEDL